ncbi:DUF4224 domain-containing protein [Oxalobacter formigenes]
MSAIIQIPPQSMTLSSDEIAEITGSKMRMHQVDWLRRNGWIYHLSKAEEPIVGRFYATMKMAGVNISGQIDASNEPRFGEVR